MEQKLAQLTVGMSLLIGIFLAGLYYMTSFDDGSSRETQITNINNEITNLNTKLANMNKTMVDAEKYRKIAEQLGAEMDTVIAAIPAEYNSLELMKVLSSEAKGAGLNILSLTAQGGGSSGTPKKGQFYEPVGAQVNLEGTFNQLMLFMSNLTKINRIIILRQLQISLRGSPTATASPILSFTGSFEAFRYTDKGQGGKGT